MAKTGDKSVPFKGVSDKRNITLTFIITLSGEFLPMQIIYGGKTNASHPRGFDFPNGFCIPHNPRHWSETLKLIDAVLAPYTVGKRRELGLPTTQKGLMVWDVFQGCR